MFDLLIPIKNYERISGSFKIPGQIILSSVHRADILPLLQTANELKRIGIKAVIDRTAGVNITGRTDRVPGNKKYAHILVRRNKAFFNEALSNPEGYELIVFPKSIEIISSSAAGAYYGIQTLRELMHIHGKNIPCCRIEDWPTFSRRGIFLTCSRGKVPKIETIKALIERLGGWKINELQFDIENVFKFKKHPRIGKGYSPFSPEDILDIQKHCKAHHIKFVPSLASFGHMAKILMLPEYSHLGEMPGYRDLPGGTTLCPGDPGSIKLIADLYDEFLPLFEAEDFNICGDEPWELGKGRSKAKAKRVGVGRVYLDFILKIRQLCLKHNKRVNMWGDIVLAHPEIIPSIPKDIVMLNWEYEPDGPLIPRTKEFTKAGLPFICCPATHDWQSHGSRLQKSIDNVSVFAKEALKCGAEGILNTAWGSGGHRNTLSVALCSFAHSAAHSWNTQGVNDAKHVHNFTFHTFGDRTGELAKSLKILGDNKSDFWAYHALTESLEEPKSFMKSSSGGRALINEVFLSSGQIEQHIQLVSKLSWPEPDKDMDFFDTVSLKEYSLACEMDYLAYRRVQLARAIRTGHIPKSSELKKHMLQMQEMAENFARIWRLRNRPSRLCENMSAFRRGIHELKHIGTKRNYN